MSYYTDINRIPDIIEPAVSALDFVLSDPAKLDVELDNFGDSGVEFWVNGIDDGGFKYRSQVRFSIWNALKEFGIKIPFPQRVLHVKGGSVTATSE